ncbi:MAG TPA: hypothetical protein VGD07_08255, partial [Methylomirabilota bacterium]
PFFFEVRPESPRMRLGRCIVQRRTWIVGGEDLGGLRFAGADVRLLSAVERLRAARGLPRRVFIRPAAGRLGPTKLMGRHKDHKPVFIDLESYLSLDLFASWVRRHGAIQVTEMLPIPEESWWREPEGVYCYEIRALVAPGASGSHRGIRGVRPDPPARA